VLSTAEHDAATIATRADAVVNMPPAPPLHTEAAMDALEAAALIPGPGSQASPLTQPTRARLLESRRITENA
jgi:hypothetical protein